MIDAADDEGDVTLMMRMYATSRRGSESSVSCCRLGWRPTTIVAAADEAVATVGRLERPRYVAAVPPLLPQPPPLHFGCLALAVG